MARKKKAPEHENLERWLVSYADFITLLFAFFVVMYSISSVNEGKYRVLSDSLVAAFRAPTKTLQPIQVGQSSKSPVSSDYQIRQSPFAVNMPAMPLPWVKYKDTNSENPSHEKAKGAGLNQSGAHADEAVDKMLKKLMDEGNLYISPKSEAAITKKLKEMMAAKTAQKNAAAADEGQVVVMNKIASEVQQAMQEMIDENLIAVRRSKLWVEVEIKASVLFASGDASINSKAMPVLLRLGKILKPFPNVIRVEGFTDDVPIKNRVYPSNWELSSARAASVVRLFVSNGIAPTRLLAVGYGKYHPIADNDTVAGRRKNRRVVLVVLATRAKENSIKSDLQGKNQAAQANDAVVEDKGIQTPEEQVKAPQSPAAAENTLPPAANSGAAKEAPQTPKASSQPVTAPPMQVPPAAKGVVQRPPVTAVPPTDSRQNKTQPIPPPIHVRPPINLMPPLMLPVPVPTPAATPLPLPSPSVEGKP